MLRGLSRFGRNYQRTNCRSLVTATSLRPFSVSAQPVAGSLTAFHVQCSRRHYAAKAAEAPAPADQPTVLSEKNGSVFRITFNNPTRLNSITKETYDLLRDGLEKAQNDPEVVYTVFTGTGDYYSSGNDLSPPVLKQVMAKPELIEQIFDSAHRFIEALIKHDKVLVALVNGPAVGVATSTLALFDQVIASDRATFYCPFTQVGLAAEGTSSLSFPAIMGHQKAAQMALFAEQISAHEAEKNGLVARVIPDAVFRDEAEKLLAKYQKLSPKSVLLTKKLMRSDALRHQLLDVNWREFEALRELWQSGETMRFMGPRFLQSKSN